MTVKDRDVTAPEAAALFGLDVDLIHQWARRRKLTAVARIRGRGRGGRGVPVYRLSEVARLAAERHARITGSSE